MSRSAHPNPSSRSNRSIPSDRPFRSIDSQMTFDHRVAVEEACAAELRGDWQAAFEHHRSVPMFAKSHHGAMLRVLADLGDNAPRWLVTRFLTVMAHRHELYGQPKRSGRVLQHVVPLLYPHGVPFEAMHCDHVEQVGALIYGCDWVVRQVDVYDLGGFEDLLSMPEAEPALFKGEYVADWAYSQMGGYRVVGADGEVMTVADAVSGEELQLLDLGFTSQHPAGAHVLGRIVTTECGPGQLFDWQPLPVDQRIAREVAAQPDRWLDVIAARARSGALAPAFSHLPDRSVSADLPQHAWVELLGHQMGAELPRPPHTMVADALKTALELAADSADVRARRHLVAELMLDELLHERLVGRFATPTYAGAWRALARELPEHARRHCDQALWMIDASPGSDELAG